MAQLDGCTFMFKGWITTCAISHWEALNDIMFTSLMVELKNIPERIITKELKVVPDSPAYVQKCFIF